MRCSDTSQIPFVSEWARDDTFVLVFRQISQRAPTVLYCAKTGIARNKITDVIYYGERGERS
ncbi:hypothetical protein D3C76_1066580 [compost metagenome]